MDSKINYSDSGLIIAPAGHGKTEDIISQLCNNKYNKKVLVLTHTNVGVQEIKNRLKTKKINFNIFNICTIASFSLKYIKMFPLLSGYDKNKELFENDIYEQMLTLLKNKHIKSIIINSYEQIFVDEYQDCSLNQHNMIKELCSMTKYKIYGDPLQSIYDFNEQSVNFNNLIENDFKFLGKLEHPWRWENSNANLGKWILNVRKELENNNIIRLYNIPNVVNFFKTNDINNVLRKEGFKCISNNTPNVILTELPYQAKTIVKYFGGKYKMQEEIECTSLKKLAILIDRKEKEEILIELFSILKSSYTGINKFNNIISKIIKYSFEFDKIKNNIELCNIIKDFLEGTEIGFKKVICMLKIIENTDGVNLCRFELIEVMKKLLYYLNNNTENSAQEVLQQITSSRTSMNYKHLVSRVLLVKGLQFKNVILVEPEKMTKKEFYVAISRATESLTIISQVDYLKFDK